MKLRQLAAGIIAAAVTASAVSCGSATGAGSAKINVVTTIFPIYDWVRQITDGVDDIGITMLLDSGVDLHSYQSTADDMVKIAGSDIFIYVGGESDDWVDDALESAPKSNRQVINLLEALGSDVYEEETVEGMEPEEEDEDDDEEEEPEYDEHVWLSLRNASRLCSAIADALCAADPDNAATYRENLAAYTAKLSDLDAKYTAAVGSAKYKTLLFADRFPFRYLVEDYGLDYYAAFSGCSAETEASFETVTFLAGKLSELGLPAVMVIDGSSGKIADAVISASGRTDCKTLMLDSLQSTTGAEAAGGKTYLAAMENNLEILKEAIS